MYGDLSLEKIRGYRCMYIGYYILYTIKYVTELDTNKSRTIWPVIVYTESTQNILQKHPIVNKHSLFWKMTYHNSKYKCMFTNKLLMYLYMTMCTFYKSSGVWEYDGHTRKQNILLLWYFIYVIVTWSSF